MGVAGQSSVSISVNGRSDRFAGFAIQSANLVESVYSLAPVLYLKVLDPFASLRQIPLTGQETLEITIQIEGQEDATLKLAVWKFWSDDINNPTEPVTWNIMATHAAYLKLKRLNYSRAFQGFTAAGVVRKIAGEVGISDFDVEDTDLSMNWIQPRFSGIEMIEYLRQRSFSASRRHGGFVSFLDRHGKLTFRSTDSLIERRPVTVLTTGKASSGESPTQGLYAFQIENRVNTMTAGGASGITGSYYDSLNDEFVVLKETPTQSKHQTTTSRVMMPSSFSNAESFYGGNLGRIDLVGAGSVFGRAPLHSQMILRMDSLLRLPGVTVGSFGRNLWFPGQAVTVNLMSARGDETSDPTFSGKWIIAELDQEFGTRPIPIAKMVLVRAGTDSDQLGGLLASPGGAA